MRASQIGVGSVAPPREIWGFDGVLTDCFARWVRVLTLGPSAQVRSPQVANYALVDVQMHYMHLHTFALKMPPVGLEPTNLAPAAQTITQLTKWTTRSVNRKMF